MTMPYIFPDVGITPACTWRSPALEELHLEYNELEAISSEVFTHLPNLQALDVSHNKLTSLPLSMWMAPKLKDLNVSCNRLRSLPSWINERHNVGGDEDKMRTGIITSNSFVNYMKSTNVMLQAH
jgi:Leucine-rich repeat (LRR) protein